MKSPRLHPMPTHVNGNMICSIDVETTGLDWNKHDIIEIAVIPLDNQYQPQKTVMPFCLTMRPRRPENVQMDALRVNRQEYTKILTNSLDAMRVADLFVEWFEKLNLGLGRRISPLAHNWVFDREFIKDWLGPLTFELIFDGRYRDTQVAAAYANDVADMNSRPCPYPKINLSYLCTQLKIDHSDAHRALPDARVTAEVYREMVMRGVGV